MSTLNLFSTGKHWLRLTSLIVLITLVIGQAQTQVAHAATLTVNQTGNQTDSLDADNICSLIDAIQVANGATDSDCGTGDAGSDVIVLGNATYTLKANYGNGTGLPIITSSISIEGNGATIERSSTGGTPQFRLFWVSTGGALSLNNVTLRNGYAIDFNSIGGGIFIDGNGTLTVNNSSLVNNYANGGGGIYDWSAGAVTINNTSFSANRGGDGGAIYNRSTELVISNSSFSGNEAGNRGGGIYNFGGTVTLSNNSFSGNSAPNGSGIYNFGTINNNGDLTNDDSITNERTMQNNGPIQNNGTIQNNDKIYNSCTGTISGNAVNGKTPLGTCVTTTTLTSSLNPSNFGEAVTFTATVTSASGTPTGTVTFSIDGVSQAPVSLASGQASFTTSSLSVGAHTITASYSGEGA
ncbi:MAG TPA: Ig-like domain repeat protein, partial [Oceanobacillus sp.]|nr:Ig-like domain repeat protein [Oceanobacillus sp.]